MSSGILLLARRGQLVKYELAFKIYEHYNRSVPFRIATTLTFMNLQSRQIRWPNSDLH
jgi:hypothetical protein